MRAFSWCPWIPGTLKLDSIMFLFKCAWTTSKARTTLKPFFWVLSRILARSRKHLDHPRWLQILHNSFTIVPKEMYDMGRFSEPDFFHYNYPFFMLYMPVKSDGQKDHLWPRYEAAKWGQVRFCHAKCDSFHLMVRKCMLFFPLERFCNNAISFQKRCKKVPSVNGNEAVTLKPSVKLGK